MTFVFAGLVFVVALAIAALQVWDAANSPTGTAKSGALRTFVIGAVLAVLISACHWI